MRPMVGTPGTDFTIEDVRGVFPKEIEITPLERPVDATVRVPGSKSITNRALIVAALADGTSRIENPLFADDPYWLMASLAQLGFAINVDREANIITVIGQRGIIPKSEAQVFVGNAGTVARFLPPVLALGEGVYRVDGTARMRERPVGDLVEALRGLGVGVGYAMEEGKFPIEVRGGGIKGGAVGVRGTKSSQFLSGLLMAAPYARDVVALEVEGGLVSRPYVGMTLGVMRKFGAEVEERCERFVVSPGYYEAREEYLVEPDASGASYFLAAAAVTGGRVKVDGLGASSVQGDLAFVEVLEEMGCEVEIGPDHVEVRGPRKGLRGIVWDMNDISDTMITLAAIAPFASSPTVINNVAHTRAQETDRVAAVAKELTRLGVRVEEHQDGLTVTPGPVRPGMVHTYDDHRMAMAFSLLGLVVPGIRIQNPSCVTKTLPDYFERLEALH